MATIRAYTTIEQSRKLAKILPLESADMSYRPYREEGGIPDYQATLCPHRFASWIGIPCWSLAALLGVLPDYTLQDNPNGTVFVVSEKRKPIMSDDYNNPVDACVAMIERLHELKML